MVNISYVALLRGINVGGKNIIPMRELAHMFHVNGFPDARTYIQSGNVVFTPGQAPETNAALENQLEKMLSSELGTDIMVVARSFAEMTKIIEDAPISHGSEERRSDVIYLKHPEKAPKFFSQLPPLREGVDEASEGDGVLYFSRLAAEASKSRMSRIVGSVMYREMTIRNWRTTARLKELME